MNKILKVIILRRSQRVMLVMMSSTRICLLEMGVCVVLGFIVVLLLCVWNHCIYKLVKF